MTKLYKLSALLVLSLCICVSTLNAQTVVYSNSFPGVGGLSPFPGGAPPATFTATSGNSDASLGSASGTQIGGTVGGTLLLTDNQLATWTTVATVPGTTNNGYAFTTAPLAGYLAPFDPTISLCTQVITWTFNIRTGWGVSGYASGQNNAAVVLVADDPNVRSLGNGYAVDFNPTLPSGLRLIKYSGGLGGVVTTVIASSSALSSATNYASVKVIYEPSTNQWTLYVRDDGAGAFSDPSTGVTALEGSAVDGTFTATPMNSFGFYSNYTITYVTSGLNALNAYFDNFAVTLSCPEIGTGGLNTCIGLTTVLTHPTPGGVWTSGTPSVATIGASTGVVTGISAGTSAITYTVGPCTVYAIVTVNPLPLAPGISGTLSVCASSTTALTLTPAPLPGTWSSSNTAIGTVSSSGVVTGISGGIVHISFTIPSGCFSTVAVTVNPIAPITGLPIFCVGDTQMLANVVVGGTWSSSDLSIATIDTLTGEVAAISAGTAVVSYVMSSGCYSTVIITVNPTPTPITGTPVVCEGLTTPLSSGPPGGFWSSSSDPVASVSGTGLVIGNSAGTAMITYKLASGCQVSIEVTVNPSPSGIGGTLTVCRESTTALTNTLAGGTWSSSNTLVGTIGSASGVLTGISAGTTNITYMMPGTGCFRIATATVNPTPTPITGVQSVCVGLTTALSSSAGGTWTSSNTSIATVVATTGVVTGVTASTVTITYSYAFGCIRTAVVTVTPLPPAITGSATVCTGRTTALNNTSVGGTWSSSTAVVGTVGSSTGIVTGLTTGTTTIVYTIGTGCTVSVVVTVIASPASITGTATVCVGGTTALANTTLGGTWTSSNTAVGTVDAVTGIVTGITANTVTISYTTPNTCFATIQVTVNPIPNAITGTTTVCVGANTTLSSTSLGGTWSSSDGTIATISGGGTVLGIAGGTCTITYTRLGCITTTPITVNALPAFIGGPNSVCLGSSITLTNTTPGGTWSSSNTGVATIGSSSAIVTTVATGTTTISYILTTTGCVRTRTTSVNPLPAVIGGPTNLCPASTVTVTNTSPGGTWSSSTTGVATVGSGTGIVTGVATGTTTITYTLATGCIRTTVVSVSTAPPAVITPIGDTIFCPGGFVTLTSSTTVGVTYQWYLGGTPIGSATSPTYIASTSGSYQVRVSLAAGCSTLSVPMSVTVMPATATITTTGGLTTTCSGTALVLNANTGVGLTYQWELGGTAIAGATASTYNALIGGSYTVRVTNSAGCWAVSSPTIVTVNPAPSNTVTISGPLTICNGSSVTFTVATGTGYSYQWYNSTGAIAGATSASYSATTAESYHAVITDGSGCSSTTATSVVVVNPLPNVTITPAGSLIFCAGGSVALDAVPGFSYQWYKNGIAIAGATNATYTATLSGGYRVRVTNTVTGCTAMTGADVTVTAVATPVILPLTPAKFCWGGSALLSTSVSGPLGTAVNYQWYFNGVLIPGATLSTYNATVAGNYSCSIGVPSSCTLSTGTVAVTEMPLPDPPITLVGSTFRTGNYYITYQWYKNLIPIAGATGYSTPATGNGNYKVAVTDTNGCQSVSLVYVLTNWIPPPANVTSVNGMDVRIFPNPAHDVINIECGMSVRAVISSVEGKSLIEKENAKEINIKELANGMYLITLYDSEGQKVAVQKLVKQ